MPIPDRIERSTEPAQPPQRVREALTSAEGLGGWFGDRATVDLPPAEFTAECVARAILDGVELGEEDIFPDPMSQSLAEGWRGGAVKAFERQLAASADAEPVPS
ncbi:MAG: hypothetical protein ACLP5E_03005 [Streptosporangiaceae bacterium]